MALRTYKPTTPSQRHLVIVDRAGLHRGAPVKALVEGKIDTFVGFKFKRTQRTTLSGTDDQCLYYVKSGIKLGIGKDASARISERADKNYATQVFYSMIIGATRMEEAKVGIITCNPTGGPGS